MSYDWNKAEVIVTLDGYKYLLGPELDYATDWISANEWCASMNGELPSCELILMCKLHDNMNIRAKCNAIRYWSSREANDAKSAFYNEGKNFLIADKRRVQHYAFAIRKVAVNWR